MATADTREPFMLTSGRRLLYVGIGLAPLLTLRGAANVLASDVFLLISAAALLFPRTTDRRKPSVARLVAAWAILAGTILAAYRADSWPEDFKIGFETLYVSTVLPWQACKALRTRRHLRLAVIWWLSGVVVCAAGALAQSRISPTIIPGTASAYGRQPGFTQHVSDFAGILATAVPLTLILAARVRGRRTRALLVSALGLFAVGLVLDGSAAAFLAISVATGYAVIRRILTVRTFTGFAVIGLAAVYFSTALDPTATLSPVERFYAVSGIEATTGSADTLSSRLATDGFAITGIVDSPLVGRGLDEQSGTTTVEGLATHNVLLGAWYQGGALVLLGLLLALSEPVRELARRRNPDFWLWDALRIGFLGGLVFEMSAPEWYTRYFWLQVALLVAAANIRRREHLPAADSRDGAGRGGACVERAGATVPQRGS
jgi:hypothetical protein